MDEAITQTKPIRKIEPEYMSLKDFAIWLATKQPITHEDESDHSWREKVDRRLAVLEYATKIQLAGIFTTGAGVIAAVILEILTS